MVRAQRRWTQQEDAILAQEVQQQRLEFGEIRDWSKIAAKIPRRDNKDCRKRFYNEVTGGLKKGLWSKEEDGQLRFLVDELGLSWAAIAKRMQNRSAEQCSKRWNHHLDPSLDHSSWTSEENATLLRSVRQHGTLWTDIQQLHFPNRSTNNIKNAYALLKHKGLGPSHGTHSRSDSADGNPYSASFPSTAPLSNGFPQGQVLGGEELDFNDVNTLSTLGDVFALEDLDLSAFPAMDEQELEAIRHAGQTEAWPSSVRPSSGKSPASQPRLLSDAQMPDIWEQGLNYDTAQVNTGRVSRANSNDLLASFTDRGEIPGLGVGSFDEAYDATGQLCEEAANAANAPTTIQEGGHISRTYITIDDVDPSVLMAVIDILVRKKAKVRFETRQESGALTTDSS